MRLLNTLYITEHRARVGLHKGNLLVAGESGRRRVPIETVDAVTLLGGAQVSSQAISRCVDRGVRVARVGRGGKLQWSVGGPTNGNVLLRVNQVHAASDPARVVELARTSVAAKLESSRRRVARWADDAREPERAMMVTERDAIGDRLAALASARDGDLIRGIEGDGSRRYFKCLRAHLAVQRDPLPFGERSRRPPRDPVNALLSFLYGLLLTEVVGAVEAVGLDPQVGFLHGLRPGRPSLALDLLEELRPSVADRLGVRLVTRQTVRAEHFTVMPGGGHHLTDEGRELVLREHERSKEEAVAHRLLDRRVPRWSLPSVQATLMARHLRGDLAAYPAYVMAP